MGENGSKQVFDEDAVDPAAAAASELAKLLVTGAVDSTTTEHKSKAEEASMESAKTSNESTVESKSTVVGAIGKVIFGELWDLIFPSASLTPTLEDIKSLVKQELQQDTLDQINGVLHDMQDALSINYAVNKRNSNITSLPDRQRLHDYLQGLDQNLTTAGVIGTLMQESYAKVGLSCFLLLAGLRIALYQEMAVVDPENKDPHLNPARSPRYATPHTGVVAQYAREYSEHVEQWWPRVVEDRERAIVFYESYALVFGNGTIGKKLYLFADKATGVEGRSVEIYDDYMKSVIEKLSRRYSNPIGTVCSWRKLIKTPINTADIGGKDDKECSIL